MSLLFSSYQVSIRNYRQLNFLSTVLFFWLLIMLPESRAGSLEDSAGLSRWLVTAAPAASDDRFWDAYEDDKHQWVVSLQGDRPSARLWVPKREEGSFYPERQESYPTLPFKVEEDPTVKGHSGEWFSKNVDDGWIIAFDKGEWGGGLWWYSPDGKKQMRISDDQVIGFIETDRGLFMLEGCSHGTAVDGKLMKLEKSSDGLWQSR